AFGSKTKEELFFGDRTEIPETWDDWTLNKLRDPRIYATKWIEQVMPQFDLADEDVKAVRAFLASRTDAKVPVRYTYHAPGEERIIAGRRLVARYNCTGCHVIENTRSEEHTSELQSRFDLVCRLLLEKKKTKIHVARAKV